MPTAWRIYSESDIPEMFFAKSNCNPKIWLISATSIVNHGISIDISCVLNPKIKSKSIRVFHKPYENAIVGIEPLILSPTVPFLG